jgi:hypothetical protein
LVPKDGSQIELISARRWRLRLVEANIRDQAAPAFGFSGLADIAAMQDQPMVAIVLVAIRNDALEFELDC